MTGRVYLTEAAARPLARIEDYVLLAVQQTLGGVRADEGKCREALKREVAVLPSLDAEEALYERLENGVCRLNLRPALKRGLTVEGIASLHADFLARFTPDERALKQELNILSDLCEREELPLDPVLSAFYLSSLGRVRAEKARHSPAYVLHYKPAYRLTFTSAVKRALKE